MEAGGESLKLQALSRMTASKGRFLVLGKYSMLSLVTPRRDESAKRR
jgi:hypothetical protein